MNTKETVERPTLELPVHCGMVSKSDIRRVCNATPYEFELTAKMLSQSDEEFGQSYAIWKKSWSLPEATAVKFVAHLYPGYPLKMILGD